MMAMIIVKIMGIFSCNLTCKIHNMSEIEEEELGHLMAEVVSIRWQYLISFYFYFIYGQLYKRD